MTRAPAVAVVIPVFNGASCLAETLRSVQAQTVRNWELVVVDDGSEDASCEIVEQAAREDRRIQLIRQENGGVSCARNRGIAESSAPLIAFLDADDLWHPNKLDAHLRMHREAAEIGVSFARVAFLSPDGLPTGAVTPRRRAAPDAAELLAENPTTTTSNWVVRRAVFEQIGGFVAGMNHCEDLEWLLRVACCSQWRFGVLPDVLTSYRTSVGGLSAGLERMEEGWLRLVAEARHYAPELVRREFARARAIQLRYLARRSVRVGGSATLGVGYLTRSLRSDWTLLLREPRRTGLTALAVLARALLPTQSMPSAPQALPPLAEEPLVSVVIPLFNAAATVAASLESVLHQTYRHLEIIIVDDGSSDEGPAICRSYEDKRIQLVHQKNRGLAGARNTGIRHATGSVVAFLDSDDLWAPEKIARHVQHLRERPAVGVSFSRSALIDRDGQPLGILQTPRLQGITPDHVLCRNPISNGSCVVLRREVLDQICFREDLYGTWEDYWFDDQFRQSEDIECWLRIAVQTSCLIEGIPEALTLYRVNSGGLSADVQKQYESWSRVLEKARGYAPELIRRQGRRARGYQLRYLARRAIRERQPRLGVRLMHRALRTAPRILVEEPGRTVITLVAAYAGAILPAGWYAWLEKQMMAAVGRLQQLQLACSRSAAREG